MTREEIIAGIKRFFSLEELVCDHICARFGEKAWMFLDTDALWVLLVIRRDIIKMPIYINSKTAHQRGMRCNRCQLVREKSYAYATPHLLAKAWDMTVPGMKASAVREKIKANADLLPCKVRLEKWDAKGNEISWTHVDVFDAGPQQPKVYEFKA